jgi:hypothetical protein
MASSNAATAVYTLKAASPTFSPGGGSYTSSQTVTLSTATSGATIRYTTDGTNPMPSSAVYSVPLNVATTTVLSAAAFKSGWSTSDASTATYSLNFGPLPAPVLSPAPGSYLDAVAVTVSAASGATIRYTIDGNDPTVASSLYLGPIQLQSSATVKAVAWKTDYTQSPVSAGAYVLKVAPPILSRPSGTYVSGTTVTVTGATAGSTLHYTTSNVDPTESDPVVPSGGSLLLGTFSLRVRAFKAGCQPSDVASATYALGSGALSGGTAFSLGLVPSGAVYAWGYNANYQLGDGTTTTRPLRSGGRD